LDGGEKPPAGRTASLGRLRCPGQGSTSAHGDAHVAGAACIASRSAAHPADQHAPVWGPPPRRAAQLTPGRALARARQAQHAEGPPGCCNGSTLAHGDAHVAGAACIASRSTAHPADQHAPVWGPPPRRAAQLTPGRALARARQAQHAEEPPGCCNGSRSSRPSLSEVRGVLRESSAACAARALPGGAAAVSAAGGRRTRSLPAGTPPVGCRQLVYPE